MTGLTAPQAKLHAYLCDRWHDPPTFQEMADHMGYSSKNAVVVTLLALEKKGFIEKPDATRSRGIKLLIGRDMDGSEIEIAGRNYRLTSITEENHARAQQTR